MAQTGIGVTYHISAAEPATHDQTGFEALTWTEFSDVTAMGTVQGATNGSTSYTPMGTGIEHPIKTTLNYGEINPSAPYDSSDAGQELFISGNDGAERDTVFSHKITLQDGTVFYNTGQIFSAPVEAADASSVVMVTGNVKFNNATVTV